MIRFGTIINAIKRCQTDLYKKNVKKEALTHIKKFLNQNFAIGNNDNSIKRLNFNESPTNLIVGEVNMKN